jgi:hypothetical protein
LYPVVEISKAKRWSPSYCSSEQKLCSFLPTSATKTRCGTWWIKRSNVSDAWISQSIIATSRVAIFIAKGAPLVEFGSGASAKTRLILDASPQIDL